MQALSDQLHLNVTGIKQLTRERERDARLEILRKYTMLCLIVWDSIKHVSVFNVFNVFDVF